MNNSVPSLADVENVSKRLIVHCDAPQPPAVGDLTRVAAATDELAHRATALKDVRAVLHHHLQGES